MDRISRQNKEIEDLNNAIDQMDVSHIYRTFHITAVKHIFFSSTHRTVSMIDHRLGHKISLDKFKIEIIAGIFSTIIEKKNKPYKSIAEEKLENSQICRN